MEESVRRVAQRLYESRGGSGDVVSNSGFDKRAADAILDSGLMWYSENKSQIWQNETQ